MTAIKQMKCHSMERNFIVLCSRK